MSFSARLGPCNMGDRMTCLHARRSVLVGSLAAFVAFGCGTPPEGLMRTAAGEGPRVVVDWSRRPFPELPFPNDAATRRDDGSPTGLRINASTDAGTVLERTARRRIDELSGFGTYQTISVSFEERLDLEVIYARHRDYREHEGHADYDFSDDAVYVIDVSPDSPDFLKPVVLDFGEGNFPQLLRSPNRYWEHDPKSVTTAFSFETYEEDLNGNGVLDPGEDLDLDGVLDHPNLHRWEDGDPDTFDPRSDLVSFYELETNTLLFRPVVPLRQGTTYAVILTRRLVDLHGEPIRSPYAFINDTRQTEAIRPALDALAEWDLGEADVAFAWTFTTHDATGDMVRLRDGLYGEGPLAWLDQDFPAEITRLLPLRDPSKGNVYTLATEDLEQILGQLAEAVFSEVGNLGDTTQLERSHGFYAYHVSGTFTSPRFLDLVTEGNPDATAWPADLTDPSLRERVARDEVQFWCVIPRREFKEDPEKPAPVVVYAHGYTSNKMEQLGLALHAKFGIAGCSIDAPLHGLALTESQERLIRRIFKTLDVEPSVDALEITRSVDVDFDGKLDSGAEFFSGYVFRTRDNLRQTLLDWMVLVRLLRSFGEDTMVDVDGDGRREVAGDFDGDGVADIGGRDNVYFASGTSLGGIVSSMLSAIEPKIVAAAPIAGGGGLIDLAMRSFQPGVIEAIGLRLLGPAVVGEDLGDGRMRFYQLFVNGNEVARRDIGVQAGIEPGHVLMVTNEKSGASRCGLVMPDAPPPGYSPDDGFRGWAQSTCAPGSDLCRQCAPALRGSYTCDLARTVRVAIAADIDDPLVLRVLPGVGVVSVSGDARDCSVIGDVDPIAVIDTFQFPVQYRNRSHAPGDPLVALEDGYGLQRGTPLMRRFLALTQLPIEAADPAIYATHYSRDLYTYREHGKTFTKAPTHVLDVITVGDPNVPPNTGISIAKSGGLVELFEPDPRYDATPNRVLIDQGIHIGIPWLAVRGEAWGPVLVDPDNLSRSDNQEPMSVDGSNDELVAPRLDPPLRLVGPTPGAPQGRSGLLFPIVDEFDGVHGVRPPGMTEPFDVGQFVLHQIGWYFHTRGQEVRYDRCLAAFDECDFVPSLPPSSQDD